MEIAFGAERGTGVVEMKTGEVLESDYLVECIPCGVIGVLCANIIACISDERKGNTSCECMTSIYTYTNSRFISSIKDDE